VRPRDIQRMIDERLHTLKEPHGVRQLGMDLERRLNRGFLPFTGVETGEDEELYLIAPSWTGYFPLFG
jgi:hypothetical protein